MGITGLSYGGKWAMFASCLNERFACAVWFDPDVMFDEKRSFANYWEPWYLGYQVDKERKPGMLSAKSPRIGAYKQLVEQATTCTNCTALMAPRPFLLSGGSEDKLDRWRALNHSVAVNKLLGYENRVAMTSRETHASNRGRQRNHGRLLRIFSQIRRQMRESALTVHVGRAIGKPSGPVYSKPGAKSHAHRAEPISRREFAMSRITLPIAGLLLLLYTTATSLQAQVPEDLAQPKAFWAFRLSSTDPKFHNADSRPIAPDEHWRSGGSKGMGESKHMGSRSPPSRPTISASWCYGPTGTGPSGPRSSASWEIFSASASAGMWNIDSVVYRHRRREGPELLLADAVREGSPRLTMTNEGSEPVNSCYFNIDYRLDDEAPPRRLRYFHTQYRQAFPVPKGHDYPILETAGRGHFVGTFLSVMANSDGWWGEGNDKFYVDGRDQADYRGDWQRRLFLRCLGFPARVLESLQRRAALYESGKGGREARHSQHLLSLAHSGPGSFHQVVAADDRAWQRPGPTMIAIRSGPRLWERGVLLSRSRRQETGPRCRSTRIASRISCRCPARLRPGSAKSLSQTSHDPRY